MTAAWTSTSSIATRTGRTAGCSRPRRPGRRSWSIRGSSPATIRAMLEARDRTPVAVLLTHGHPDHAGAAAAVAGADVPVYVHPGDVDVFRDPARVGARGDRAAPRARGPPDDGRRRRPASSPASGSGCSTRPGTRPGRAASSPTTTSWSSRATWCSRAPIGRSDFPESDPEAMAGEPGPLPHAARRPADPAGPRSRDHGRSRAGDEPLPGGPAGDRHRAPTRDPGPALARWRPDARALRPRRAARPPARLPLRGDARASRRPSSSRRPRGRRATSSPRRCTRSRTGATAGSRSGPRGPRR